MKIHVVLAVFLSVAAVASAFILREACRREWCVKNTLHRTRIDGKEYCCLDYYHEYLIVEYRQSGLQTIKKCWCKVKFLADDEK
ncbi:hypothetical protein RRG08_051591 [Elysia crispata]|uniref:Uncharacterized protein n=1 Tax=Elysia crispata TaxID=231223 RepID=A0AAE1A2H2_9GAST|nr:hypothetical protein RRG08_051591 [Elysia crispata]